MNLSETCIESLLFLVVLLLPSIANRPGMTTTTSISRRRAAHELALAAAE